MSLCGRAASSVLEPYKWLVSVLISNVFVANRTRIISNNAGKHDHRVLHKLMEVYCH